MSRHQEPIRSCVLHVSVSHLIYPVTEKVLGQIFDAYGVNDVCLVQQATHLDVFVEFQSWHEASQARDALHGRCIYDGCCLLDIQHAPPSINIHRLPNSEPVVVDWDRVEVEPLACSSTPSSSTSAPATATTTSMAICKDSTEVHADTACPVVVKALDSEEVVAFTAAPHGTSSSATTKGKDRVEVYHLDSYSTPSASTLATPFDVITSTTIREVFPEVHKATIDPIADKALDCEVLVVLPASHNTSALTTTKVEDAREGDDIFPAAVRCLKLCLDDNGDKYINNEVPVCLPTAYPHPSPDRSLCDSGVPRPLPWPSFLCDGDSEPLTSSCMATQGIWPCLQPKPPWMYYAQTLLSKGPICREILYIIGNLKLVASCQKLSSPKLPLYRNDWLLDYSVTNLVLQKNWDPGVMLRSDIGPLSFPRFGCLPLDPCLPEANHSMEILDFHKFISVRRATYTATHQWETGILPGNFYRHLFGTLNSVTVFQYCNKFRFTDCLLAWCSGRSAAVYCLYLQWYTLISIPCDHLHHKHSDLSAPISWGMYHGQLSIAQLRDGNLSSGFYVEKLWDPGGICQVQFMSTPKSSHFMALEHQLNHVWRAQCVPCCVLAKNIEEEMHFHIWEAPNSDMSICWVDMKPLSYVYHTFSLFAHNKLKKESTYRFIIASYATGYKLVYTSMFTWRFLVRGVFHYGPARCQWKFACSFNLGCSIVKHFAYPIDYLFGGSHVPWHSSFGLLDIWKSTLMKLNGHKWAMGDLQVVNKLTAIVIQWFSLVSLPEITRLATRRWDPGIASIVLLLSTTRTVSTKGLIQFVHDNMSHGLACFLYMWSFLVIGECLIFVSHILNGAALRSSGSLISPCRNFDLSSSYSVKYCQCQ